MKSGQITAYILITGAGLFETIGVIALFILQNSGLSSGGMITGVILLSIITLPIIGIGAFLLIRSKREASEDALITKQRQLLDMVTARGELRLTDAAVELQSPHAEIKRWVYNLVGLGVFSGYVNWEDGILYSSQAANLRDLSACKRCGGKVSLAGKGVSKCQYCGTEYFLS